MTTPHGYPGYPDPTDLRAMEAHHHHEQHIARLVLQAEQDDAQWNENEVVAIVDEVYDYSDALARQAAEILTGRGVAPDATFEDPAAPSRSWMGKIVDRSGATPKIKGWKFGEYLNFTPWQNKKYPGNMYEKHKHNSGLFVASDGRLFAFLDDTITPLESAHYSKYQPNVDDLKGRSIERAEEIATQEIERFGQLFVGLLAKHPPRRPARP